MSARAVPLLRSLWPYVVPVLLILVMWPLTSPTPLLGDHFQFWAAGHLVTTGRSPYDRGSWEQMAAYGDVAEGVAVNTVPLNLLITRQVWLYPPQTAFALAPFGALPLALGAPALHLAVIVGAFAGLAFAARAVGLDGARLAFALTLAVLAEPFVITIRMGHPIGVLLLGATLAFVAHRERSWRSFAIGAALLSIKPQIVAPFGLAIGALAALRRDMRSIGAAAAAVVVTTVVPALAYPFPLTALAATGERGALDLATTGALARDLGGGVELTAALIAAGTAALVAALRLAGERDRPAVAFSGGLALSLVVAPYAQAYDHLLALPAAFTGIALARGRRGELASVALFALFAVVAPWVLFMWWPLQGLGERTYQAGMLGAVPLLSLLGLALAALLGRGR